MKLQVIDRRLVVRVLALWKNSVSEDRFPGRSQVGPDIYGDDWAHCFIVDLDPNINRSRISFVGETIQDPAQPSLKGQSIGDCEEGTVPRLVITRIPSLLKRRAPIAFGGYATHAQGPILYRSILLPLAEDGHTIDGVLAAVNHREAATDRGLHTAPFAVAV